ncbi:MAG TPA: hypothetical protein VFE05_10060 [Longimicrobiaceae bacterium]|jgi:hypothetical protein|nr:hypothetical protein [Longimicrobiaceae bacterium]
MMRNRAAVVAFAALAAVCWPDAAGAQFQHSSQQRSYDTQGNFTSLDVPADAELSADRSDVVALGPGQRVWLRQMTPDGATVQMSWRAGTDGAVERDFRVNGQAHAFDDQARAWVRRLLTGEYRSSGLGDRALLLRKRAELGLPRVLETIRTDSVAGRRANEYAMLLDDPALVPRDAERVLREAGRVLGSGPAFASVVRSAVEGDHVRNVPAMAAMRLPVAAAAVPRVADPEMRVDLLRTFAWLPGLSLPRGREAFLRAWRTLPTEDQKVRVLFGLFARPAPLVMQADAIRAARALRSPADRASVLLAAPAGCLRDPGVRAAYDETLRTLAPSPDRTRAEQHLADGGRPTARPQQ